jgi:iron complex transport system substrate-binding protein
LQTYLLLTYTVNNRVGIGATAKHSGNTAATERAVAQARGAAQVSASRRGGDMHGRRLAKVLAWALLAAAAGPAAARAEVTVVDAGGRSVRVTDASRILCIGGDVTEIVYALGAGDRVVAVDTTSQYPPQALKEKTSVGYMRALSSEGVISVGASLTLASERAGPPEVVKTLKASSVPYIEVPEEYSQQGLVAKLRLVARAIGTEAEGERIAREVTAGFAALAELRAKVKRPVGALFVLGVQNGRIMVGGKGTSADAVLALAGARNVAAGASGFRPVGDEAVVEMAPDVIVGMRRTPSGSGDNDMHDLSQLAALKGVQSTPAGAAKRIVLMDGAYLLGFGPRVADAARDLMRAFYPEIGAAGAPR